MNYDLIGCRFLSRSDEGTVACEFYVCRLVVLLALEGL